MNHTSDRELTISRRFHAPRDLVFDAWTRSEVLDRWMGPSGFTTTTQSFEFRVGGQWRYIMQHPEYGTFPNRVRFIEIVPSHRIVYDHDTGEEGGPEPFRVTVTFTDQGEYTELTMRTLFGSVEEADAKRRMGAETFGGQTLSKLGAVLDEADATDLVIVRELTAPVARVWNAWTTAEALGVWWGPKGLGLRVERHDFREGGLFHYAMLPPNGAPPMWGRMLFRVIEPEVRLEWINSFADEAGEIIRPPIAPLFPREIYNRMSFEPVDSGTRLTLRSRPIRATADDRSFFVGMQASMEAGFGGTFDQLQDWLAA